MNEVGFRGVCFHSNIRTRWHLRVKNNPPTLLSELFSFHITVQKEHERLANEDYVKVYISPSHTNISWWLKITFTRFLQVLESFWKRVICKCLNFYIWCNKRTWSCLFHFTLVNRLSAGCVSGDDLWLKCDAACARATEVEWRGLRSAELQPCFEKVISTTPGLAKTFVQVFKGWVLVLIWGN